MSIQERKMADDTRHALEAMEARIAVKQVQLLERIEQFEKRLLEAFKQPRAEIRKASK